MAKTKKQKTTKIMVDLSIDQAAILNARYGSLDVWASYILEREFTGWEPVDVIEPEVTAEDF